MLENIISFSIKNKLIIAICTLALIVWGAWSAKQLPIDAVPDITNNQVQIITLCPTLAGQEVEQLVTYPIEQSIANLPDLAELRSISRFGLSVITVVFDDKTDIYFARQLINERLKEAEEKIPAGVGSPELAPVSTGLGEVYQYIIHPSKEAESKYSAMDLRTMQDWIVARQLYGTPGIAEVNSFGGLLKQYEVSINPNRLLAMEVTIPEIFEALEKNNENTGGAYIDKKPNAYFIRGVGLVSSFADVENIVVKSNPNGIPILIKDIAKVQFGNAVRYGAMTYNGEKDAVGGVIMMLKGSNSAEVVNRIKEKLPTIQKSLPPDVVIEPFLDRRDLVDRAMNTVETNLVEGALIVIFVLVLFLGNFRAGLIVASAIPLSMLFALGLMNIFNVSANLMSLGAIDFGLIVDGAVIIVESVFHRIAYENTGGVVKLSQKQMDETVLQSAKRMMNSAAFGQIIILIVYVPIFTLIGIEGKMFKPMAQTVSFAILGALILSVTYIPMMSAFALSRKTTHKKNISDRMMDGLLRIYTPLLATTIRFRKTVIASTITMFIISLYLFSKMGGEFIPTLQEGDFAFHCILPQGTSLSQSIETSMQASRKIKAFDEVKMVVGKTGSAEVPTDPMPPEATDLMIILKSKAEWTRDIPYEQLADEMLEQLEDIPGVFFEKSQPIQMRFNELMTGIRQDVAVKIFGEDMDTLLTYANQVSAIVQKVDGATEPMVERVEGLPQIVIHYNRSQIANYGLNIEDINHIVSTAFAGGKAGVVFENERRFDLIVRLDSTSRSDIEDLDHLYIPIKSGSQIPLSQVAEIKLEVGASQISREDGKRRIVIGFNVKNRDVASVVKDIQKQLNAGVKLPEGYYYTFGGTFENLKAASARLAIAIPAALTLIFILLFFTFHSTRQAALIFTAIPMSAIGGVFALWIRDMPFSISAGIGFIALFGVAVLNGIVLIGTFNQLEKEGTSDIIQRILEGTKMRLRPVLMTATVASFGFFPMAFSHGAGAEVQKPLATVVIGGLVTATALTLFVLPLLYLVFSKPIRMKSVASLAGLILLLLPGTQLSAQSTMPKLKLEDVISRALQNNLQLQSSRYEASAAQSLTHLGYELPSTAVNFQYGQFNSLQNDNHFSIDQSFPLPGYFRARSDLYQAEWKNSEINYLGTALQVKTEIRQLYDRLQFIQHTQKELQSLDSIYVQLVNKAELRYATGETNLLEKNAANLKLGEIRLMLAQYEAAYTSAYASLKRTAHISEDFDIAADAVYQPLNVDFIYDTALISSHPALMNVAQQALIADAQIRVQRKSTAPELQAGYFNQSIIGFQNVAGNEVYYDGTSRFQGFNIGLRMPLLLNGNKAKIESLQARELAKTKEAEFTREQLETNLSNAFDQYYTYKAEYTYYMDTALQYADQLLLSAKTGFTIGEIGYLEYITALQYASDTRIRFLERVHQLNQTVIQIQSLTQQ